MLWKFHGLRLPSSSERERALGFDVNYATAATKGSNPQDASDAQAVLTGNSFSVYAASWLCQQILLDNAALARPLEARELVYFSSCRST